MRKRDTVGMLPWVLGESMGKSCDEELFAQLVAGDRECLRPLMERHGDALTLYVNGYIHDIDAAEDLMIEAFARMLAKRPRLREGGFKSYLYKTACNRVSGARKRFLPTLSLTSPSRRRMRRSWSVRGRCARDDLHREHIRAAGGAPWWRACCA